MTSTHAEPASIAQVEVESGDLAAKIEVESKKTFARWSHAKELLGKYYKGSVVKDGEGVAFVDHLLHQWTFRALRKNWKNSANLITQTIIEEAEKYNFDPIFLMAVIQSESSFQPTIIGPVGEIGLMQITPDTGKWISQKFGFQWTGPKSLKDPVKNIRIGAAYMSYLRGKFEGRSQLYIAAYNMGSANVNRALARQVTPKQYPSRVLKNYVSFYNRLSKVENTLN